MTVKELLEALAHLPVEADDLPVVVRVDGEGERDAWGVNLGEQWRQDGWSWQPGSGSRDTPRRENRSVVVIRTNPYGA